jgi:hypothetical protein
LLCALLFMLHPFQGKSQVEKNRFIDLLYFETKVNYGFIIPHHIEMWGISKGYFPSWELSVFRQTDGRHDFHYMRNYPQIGFSYQYTDFGGSEILGVMNAFLPVIKIPVFSKNGGKFLFSMGAGLAHLTNKFHPVENYRNLTIGSYFNAAVKFELAFQQKISNRVYLNAGISMLHVSNGSVKTPNYGLNIPLLNGGFQWKLSSRPIQYLIPEKLIRKKGKFNFRAMVSLASKQIISLPGKDFGVLAASGTFLYYYKNTARISIGADLIYDNATRYKMESEAIPTDHWNKIAKKGFSFGHEWVFSNLAIFVNMGYYFESPLDDENMVYHKIGVNYTFFKHLIAGINLQTHWAKADFLGFGLGFKI